MVTKVCQTSSLASTENLCGDDDNSFGRRRITFGSNPQSCQLILVSQLCSSSRTSCGFVETTKIQIICQPSAIKPVSRKPQAPKKYRLDTSKVHAILQEAMENPACVKFDAFAKCMGGRNHRKLIWSRSCLACWFSTSRCE